MKSLGSSQSRYRAVDFVPSNFICHSCKDILIGARVADCGCTFCTMCWEKDYLSKSEAVDREDYVFLEQRTCESCSKPTLSSLTCHVMDDAIFHMMMNLAAPPED